MIPIDTAAHRVDRPGRTRMSDRATRLKADHKEKELRASMEEDRARIVELQEALFAENQRALLLIFQAMDAAGKDSCVRHVLSGVDPQGVQAWSFKAPSEEERDHDFLWRHARALPARGMIGIHNRSHYEEVLVVRVHPELLPGQRLPDAAEGSDPGKAFWQHRFASIVAFEEHLARQGTAIMKFYLHMGRDAQRKRFLERIDDPRKNWKFSSRDVRERARWNAYMHAYEEAIGATAAPHAPWYIVPADDQWETRAVVARLIREQLEAMDPRVPALTEGTMDDLAEARRLLQEEGAQSG